jgi:hypothetical protein
MPGNTFYIVFLNIYDRKPGAVAIFKSNSPVFYIC